MARAERSVEKASPERETFHVKAQVQGGRGQRKKKKRGSSEERREFRKMLKTDRVAISRI